MIISVFKLSEKVLFLFFTFVFIDLFFLFGYYTIFENEDFWDYLLFVGFGILSIILIIVTFVAFRSKFIINKEGITLRKAFKQQYHSWSEIKFAAEYDIIIRITNTKGFIISFDLDKEEFTYSHFAKGFSKKHFVCLPYSEETKENLILYLPYEKYLGLAFTNDSLDK